MSCETHQFYGFIYMVQLEKDGYDMTTSNILPVWVLKEESF